MKRIISLMLSLIMILSLVCGAVPAVSAASALKTSDMGINMIKSFEGFHKWPQMDNGQWTVGYGTGISESEVGQYNDDGITQEQAAALLKEYLESFEKSVNSFIDAHNLKLNQQQFDALVSFTYNLGPSWMQSSGIFRTAVINGTKGNEFIYAMAQFGKAGGSPVGGLIERRLCEANLYLNGTYSTQPPANYKYVIYNGNMDGVVPTVTIQGYNSTLSAAIKSTVTPKAGYRFMGWYTQAEGGDWITVLGSKSVGTNKLYAHWQNGEGPRNADGSIKGTTANYSGYAADGESRNVYKAPGGVKTGTVDGDEKVTVSAEYVDSSNRKWGKISSGWIDVTGGLVATPSYEEDGSAIDPITVTVTTSGVNNRIGPGTNYAKNGTYTKGQQLTLTAVQKGGNYTWGKSEQGWIALQYTDYDTVKLQGSSDAKKVTAIGTIIRADRVNVRAGAGTSHAKVGSYNRNDEVKISLRQKVGNIMWGLTEKGWVSLYYVKLTEVEEGSVPDMGLSGGTAGTTGGITSGTTSGSGTTAVASGKVYNCNTLRIRAAAGTSNAHIGDYKSGTYVDIYETTTVRSEIWGRTDKGWISMRYVKLDAPTTGDGVTGRVYRTTTVNVRSGAGTHYPKVGSLASGTKVEIFEYVKVGNATWGRIAQGWVSLYYVKLDAPLTNLDSKVETEIVPPETEAPETEPEATKYAVKIAASTNGSVSASASSAEKGAEVTLTAAPKAGYELDTLVVKDADKNALSVTDNKFIMPESDVTVTATFKVQAGKYNVTINSSKNGKVTANTASCAAGTEVIMTVDPNAGYELDTLTVMNTTNNSSVAVSNGKFIMPEGNVNVVATFKTAAAGMHKVTINGTANGKITANTTAAKAGDMVILTIAPSAEYQLDELSVKNTATNAAVAVSGTGNTRTFTMPASNVTIAATFKIVKYNVSVGASVNGSISVNSSQYAKGAAVTVDVAPATGYQLDKLIVKDASDRIVNTNNNKFTMPASNVTVTATFKKAGYYVAIGGIANGTITADSTYAEVGETVILTVKPHTGYELDTLVVKDASNKTVTVTDGKFTMPASNVTVTATFKITKYLVEIASTANGSVKVDPDKYAKGETVTLTVEPATGYELDQLTVKNASGKKVTVSDNQFAMPASKVTVTATFKLSTYGITVAKPTNGTVKTDVSKAKMGDTVNLTITPKSGYELEKLVVKDADGKEVAVAGNKFMMPASKVNITASFRVIPEAYALTVDSAIVNGTVTAKNGSSVVTSAKSGDTITLTIAPAAGYELKELTVKDAINAEIAVSGTGNTRTFTMPASDVKIAATFEAKATLYKVTYTGGDFVNIRAAADASSADLGDIPNNTVLEALSGSTDAWIRVKYNGIEGWVGTGNLTKITT